MTSGATVIEAVKQGDAMRLAELIEDDVGLASARDESGISALLLARYHQRPDMVDLLRAGGADVDVFAAAALGDAQRVTELLDADPALATAWSSDGFTPLHLTAFFCGDPNVARLLLARGADPDAVARNPMAVRPLNSAAAGGARAVAEVLLESGADVEPAQHGGYTPLHSAAANGDAELAELLLVRGADSARPADDGRTPAELAAERGHAELAARLRTPGGGSG